MSKPTAQEFIAALRRVEEAGDVEAMLPLFAEDARISNPTDAQPHAGTDGVRKFWDAYRKSFEKIGSRFHHVVESDGAALLEWTSDVRTAAGLPTSYDGVSVFETRDGKITRFTAYFDPADLSATPDGAPAHGGTQRSREGGYGTVADGRDVMR